MRNTIHTLILTVVGVVSVVLFGIAMHVGSQTSHDSTLFVRDGIVIDPPQFARDDEWNNHPQLARDDEWNNHPQLV